MGIFSRLFGEQQIATLLHKAKPLKNSSKNNVFNAFSDSRNRILAFDSTLISLAASGIHDEFDRSLHIFHSELAMHNSNISR